MAYFKISDKCTAYNTVLGPVDMTLKWEISCGLSPHYARFLTVGIKAKHPHNQTFVNSLVDCPKTFHRTLTQTLTICFSTDFCEGQPFVDFYKDIHLKQLRCMLFCFSIILPKCLFSGRDKSIESPIC